MAKITLLGLMLALGMAAQAQYQRWWGLYTEGAPYASTGTGTAETYHCAASYSGSRAILTGATLHGVRFYLRDKTNVSDVQVWLSKNRPASGDKADIAVINVPQADLVDYINDRAMMEVALPQPYTFESGQSVLVGYSFKVNSAKTDADKNPVMLAVQNAGKLAFLLRTSKSIPSWNELGAMSGYGALAMQLLISNPSLPTNAVEPTVIHEALGLKGSSCGTWATLTSRGFAPVESINYEITVAGQSMSQSYFEPALPIAASGSTMRLPLNITLPQQTGYSDCQITITNVNGQPNEADVKSISGTALSVDREATRRSVVEEYTGTWCTNCPRGTVGMNHMAADYGDRFIGIAIHQGSDPMVVSTFNALNNQHGGAPTCTMDRVIECDPYLGDDLSDYHYHAGTTFGRMLERTSEADLALTATWADAQHTSISYRAATTFYIDSPKADYALAFVLTADGLRGTTAQWAQVNGESGKNTYPDEDMDVFRNAPNPVTDIEYNHVAIGGTGVTNGQAGTISAPIVSGQTQTYNGTFSIDGNGLVQDKDRLHAIVLLIHTPTGYIVNAAKASIGDSGATDIRSIEDSSLNIEHSPYGHSIYDLQGRPVVQDSNLAPRTSHLAPRLKKGIYIINGHKVAITQ